MKCIEFTYEYLMAKHQHVIECSAAGRHPKQTAKEKKNEFPKNEFAAASTAAVDDDDDIIVD